MLPVRKELTHQGSFDNIERDSVRDEALLHK